MSDCSFFSFFNLFCAATTVILAPAELSGPTPGEYLSPSLAARLRSTTIIVAKWQPFFETSTPVLFFCRHAPCRLSDNVFFPPFLLRSFSCGLRLYGGQEVREVYPWIGRSTPLVQSSLDRQNFWGFFSRQFSFGEAFSSLIYLLLVRSLPRPCHLKDATPLDAVPATRVPCMFSTLLWAGSPPTLTTSRTRVPDFDPWFSVPLGRELCPQTPAPHPAIAFLNTPFGPVPVVVFSLPIGRGGSLANPPSCFFVCFLAEISPSWWRRPFAAAQRTAPPPRQRAMVPAVGRPGCSLLSPGALLCSGVRCAPQVLVWR